MGFDTLHCSLSVTGSAAQFNSSVSAMPPPPSRTFETPVHSGTADTLLLRYPPHERNDSLSADKKELGFETHWRID